MKKIILSTCMIAALFLVASASGCQHDSNLNTSPGSNNGGTNTTTNPASGVWTVTLYTEGVNNETHDYHGYTFDFTADGQFLVANNGQTTNGTWLRKLDDNRQKFILSVVSSDHRIEALNEDWIIVSSTGTELDLSDDHAGRSEVIHFTKQ